MPTLTSRFLIKSVSARHLRNALKAFKFHLTDYIVVVIHNFVTVVIGMSRTKTSY